MGWMWGPSFAEWVNTFKVYMTNQHIREAAGWEWKWKVTSTVSAEANVSFPSELPLLQSSTPVVNYMHFTVKHNFLTTGCAMFKDFENIE